MADEGDFVERDRRAAAAFGDAARAAGVRRIVFLGGLGHEPGLSRHLASRQEVGRVLAASGVPTIELRASVVIGGGSLPFDMARRLVEKLPVMVTPTWVRTLAQPIAAEDVVPTSSRRSTWTCPAGASSRLAAPSPSPTAGSCARSPRSGPSPAG